MRTECNSGWALTFIAAGVILAALFLGGCDWGNGGFETCRDAIKSGAAPLHRGDQGWNPHLDADGDGVACENGRTTR